MKCPGCGQTDEPFHVEVSTIAYLYHDGSIDMTSEAPAGSDIGDDAYVDCTDCDWSGTISDIGPVPRYF